MIRELVPAALDGERLDRLVAMVTDRSRSAAAALVAAGAVRVGGEIVTSGKHRVAEGDEVVVDAGVEQAPVPPVAPDPSVEFDVVLADGAVVVVDKPAGLVVHPGAGTSGGTLADGLVARFPDVAGVGEPDRPGIVHRLDRDTSGLLVVARTEAARSSLVDQLGERSVERVYLALVHGLPSSDEGLVDAPVGRSAREPTRMAVTSRGREARTRYRVLERFDGAGLSLLECRLETGRTHQIRVHLKAIGHHVVADPVYGGGRRSAVPVPRLFLHAARLAFDHPSTGERAGFESPLPPDLATPLAALRAR